MLSFNFVRIFQLRRGCGRCHQMSVVTAQQGQCRGSCRCAGEQMGQQVTGARAGPALFWGHSDGDSQLSHRGTFHLPCLALRALIFSPHQ